MFDANPYAAPRACEPPKSKAFRPSIISSWMCWALRGGNGPAFRDSATGEIVLRQPRVLRGCFGCLAIVVPAAVGTIAFINPPITSDWWVPWVLGVGSLFAGSLGLLSNERVYHSDSAIRKSGPFLLRRRIPWGSVSVIEFDESGSVHLTSSTGTKLAISADLCGLAELPDALDRGLPSKLREEHAEHLWAYRRFVGERRT